MLKLYSVTYNVTICPDPTLSYLNENKTLTVRAESELKALETARDVLIAEGYYSTKVVSCEEIPINHSEVHHD